MFLCTLDLNSMCINKDVGKLCFVNNYCTLYCQKYWHPLLIKGLTTLVISMSTNLNVEAYNDILVNCIATGVFSILT